MKVLGGLVAVIGLVVASTACAQPLDIAIDIDSTRLSGTDISGEIVTQPGFLSWDMTNVGTSSDPLTVDGVTFQIFGLQGANQSRVRAAADPPGESESLLRDFVFNEGANGRAVGLRISGLPVGAYAIESWHYDSVLITEESTQIEIRNQGGSPYNGPDFPTFPFGTSPGFLRFDVESDGLVKEIIYREASDTNRARLNAFRLQAVPEPTSIVLVAMGLGLAACRGRRRTGR